MTKIKKVVIVMVVFSFILAQVSYAKVSPLNKAKNQQSISMKNYINDKNIVKDIDTATYMYQNLENAILKKNNCESVQQYIDDILTSAVGGGAEWYAILFYKMYGDSLDYKKYKAALDKYVSSDKKISITTMQLIALTYLCIDPNNIYLTNICDETIGKQGIMSYIFGLHLLNNGVQSSVWTKDMVIEKIIGMYDKNKGYSYMGNDTDIDVTSMVVQALAPYYKSDERVKNHIDSCIDMISKNQLDDGTFINSELSNSESISQVILMASTMDIDIENDNRIIKNNINLYMALSMFNTSDGLYSHIIDNNSNTLSTQQACYSLGSMVLYKTKNENLFKLR